MEKPRSVYRRGAEDGLILGPVMAIAVLLSGATSYVAWLAIPAILAIAAVPATATVLLRRGYAEDNYRSTFSALWLEGICAFFFGGMLMGVVAFAAMRWIWPGYIMDQVNTLIDILSASLAEDNIRMAHNLRAMADNGELPAPIDLVLELIYIAVFTGSLLSMLLSLLIRSRRRPTPPPYDNPN